MKRKCIAFMALGFALSMGLFSCTTRTNASNVDTEEEKDTTLHLSLLFAGDLMLHAPQFNVAKMPDGTYDFNECFEFMKDEIESADVAIANFETTTAGPPYSGYPQFCAPDSYVEAIKNSGFDILVTANNHSCDRRALGIDRTIHLMDSLGIPHLGTYVSPESRAQQYPFLLEKNGFRIVLLNGTYGTNGIRVPDGKVVNSIDKEEMAKDIAKAKAMNPDAIIAIVHWGQEYTMRPVPSQVEMADWLLAQGVTHIIGGHPHVIEPVEVRTDENTGEKHVVLYSMGNYISNMTPTRGKTNDGGMVFRMDLEKDSVVRVKDCRYSLQWVSRPNVSGHKVHRVYPVNVPREMLNQREQTLLDNFVNQVRPVFEKNNKGEVKEYMVDVSKLKKK